MQRALACKPQPNIRTLRDNDAEGQIFPRYVDVGLALQILYCCGNVIFDKFYSSGGLELLFLPDNVNTV